jgi:hypothetical protein
MVHDVRATENGMARSSCPGAVLGWAKQKKSRHTIKNTGTAINSQNKGQHMSNDVKARLAFEPDCSNPLSVLRPDHPGIADAVRLAKLDRRKKQDRNILRWDRHSQRVYLDAR